jgi:hypothetical protein
MTRFATKITAVTFDGQTVVFCAALVVGKQPFLIMLIFRLLISSIFIMILYGDTLAELVKAKDSKSFGVPPRRFESCRCRS